MSFDIDQGEAQEQPKAASVAIAHAAKRLRQRRWLVLGAVAILAAFTVYADLQWQAALLGAALTVIAAAATPHTNTPSGSDVQQNASGIAQSRKAHFDDMLQAMPHPAILLTSDGTIVGYNASAHEHWEKLRRGSHLSLVVRQPVLLDAVTAVSGGARPVTVNYTERVPVERRIEATVASLPLARKADPQGPGILVSLRDLSEQEKLNQMRADFVANASHELRTPLSSLLGFIETLQGPAREDKAATNRFLGIMQAQAQRMKRLIDDLLSLSRVEMNVHLQPTEIVDLQNVVAHVAEALSPVANDAGIKLMTALPKGHVPIRGDRDELVQLTQNLVQNAIKYGRKKGFVRVSLKRLSAQTGQCEQVQLSVEDNGQGIAPEHLPRLTERFYRVDVATSREKGGTGLGLAIVKHIVMRHRGDLQITSDMGKGSTFSVTFDMADQGAYTVADSMSDAQQSEMEKL